MHLICLPKESGSWPLTLAPQTRNAIRHTGTCNLPTPSSYTNGFLPQHFDLQTITKQLPQSRHGILTQDRKEEVKSKKGSLLAFLRKAKVSPTSFLAEFHQVTWLSTGSWSHYLIKRRPGKQILNTFFKKANKGEGNWEQC